MAALGLAGLLLSSPSHAVPTLPPPDFTIAFIGDQGLGGGAALVLQLIASEGADMVLHQGDLGYSLDAAAWDQRITNALGADFPYFATVGNHDCLAAQPGCSGPGDWPDYQSLLQARLDRIPDAHCVGDLGVNASCDYKGIFFILSGVGTEGSGHETFIANALAGTDSIWRICSWHKNHTLMQAGFKGTEVPLSTYDACRAGGAIIATGHEHSYSRTHLMSSFATQTILGTGSLLQIGEGQTIAFVSGLAGFSIRPENPARAGNPWWASVYTSTQGADHGALFCSFNVLGMPDRAHCYFKDVSGVVADEFDLESIVVPEPGARALRSTGVAGLLGLAGARGRRRSPSRGVSGEPIQGV